MFFIDILKRSRIAPGSRRFGISTAGRTQLYSVNGKLLFAGGITQSRGHQGDNPGEAAVVALLAALQAQAHDAQVFGCGLFKHSVCRP